MKSIRVYLESFKNKRNMDSNPKPSEKCVSLKHNKSFVRRYLSKSSADAVQMLPD